MDSITVQAYWNEFLPFVQKILKEKEQGKIKHSCVGKDWWKSRYSDFLTNTNSAAKTDEEYHYRKTGYQVWEQLWQCYSHIMEGEINETCIVQEAAVAVPQKLASQLNLF